MKKIVICLFVLIISCNVADAATFTGTELLGRPTDRSVTVNVVAATALEVYFEYGISSGVYTDQTPTISSVPDKPIEVVISGLEPNRLYYYRMVYSENGGSTWVARDEHTFHTQRAPGSTFTFTIVTDSHLNNMGNSRRYEQAMRNVNDDHPDFHLDLGDTFMVDGVTSESGMNQKYLAQRPYMEIAGHSAPIFLAIGNHENEEGWNFDDTPSQAILSINARKLYYPTPVSDGFYSGNDDPLAAIDGDHLREDYYAFEWGDALFVVLDPFQYTMKIPYSPMAGETNDEGSPTNDRWTWTLGQQQFNWFRQTLENSNAKFKFVFAHHMVGGSQTYVRGGAGPAHMFEWGGYNANGSTWGFNTKRPGWGDDPIHQLMVDNGVSAFFHGHDHQFAYEKRDGVVYQECPSPSMTGSGFNLYSEADPYTIKVLPNSGHIRVRVSPHEATVDYVRSDDAAGGGINGEVSYSYTITAPDTPDPPVLNNPEDGSIANSTDVPLSVSVSDPGSDLLDVTFYGRQQAENTEDFTVIVLPDTQYYSQNYPAVFASQTEWITDNRDLLNIQFVAHEGDIVQTWDSETQWNNADTSMSVLDNNYIPYSVVPGNHDHAGGVTSGSTSYYNAFFPVSRFAAENWWGGNYDENDNNYQLMTIGNDDYIFLSLDFCPSSDELEWANDVLDLYQDRKGILTTHGYLDENVNRNVPVCGSTQYIWDDLIRHHANLQLVLCGHVHSESRRTDYNLAGNPVYQMLADYQDDPNGGNGFLRILSFVPSEDKIYVQTYSPYTDEYETDSNSQFTLEYAMGSSSAGPWEVIGEDTNVVSGSQAEILWPALMNGMTYEWYVEVENSSSAATTGPVWTFSVSEISCDDSTDCDDGLYCNGAETCEAGECQPGISVVCDDGIGCTVDSCNEATDSCVRIADDAFCDNGLFCDGSETCDIASGCQAGTPVVCDDGVGCTADACNEAADACDNVADDASCDNGLFCDGIEICDTVLDCRAGEDPCSDSSGCDEANDACLECEADNDCDDGLWCNGAETCAGGLCQAGGDQCPGQTCDEANDQCIAGPTAKLESGVVTVGGEYVTVNLVNTYIDPVVVCSVQYTNNTVPVITRVANATATTFDVRLQNPSGGAVAAENVSYLVVEEGTWSIDGVNVEAHTYLSTVTDEDGSWVGESQGYGQSFTNPVVLGQVMSDNDDWSVFWCQGGSRSDPPSSTVLKTGKTVCEDYNTSRADEIIGYIVFEAGHGSIGGVEYEAKVGPDAVKDVTDAPPYSYSFAAPFASAPQVTVVNMAGMDGGNGGWAYVYGASMASSSTLNLAIDEDQIRDSERSHTAEQVGYVAFAQAMAYPAAQGCDRDADCDDGLYCNGAETCEAGECQPGISVACDDGIGCTVDSCNEATDSCARIADDAFCDNGLFCDGAETCDIASGCQAGIPVVCDDGVGCTADTCNEATDACDNVADDASCDNGLFCDGIEICDTVLDCRAGEDPCSDSSGCDEANDACLECEADNDCDDGLWCNGAETCAGGLCQAGNNPCLGQVCDEVNNECTASNQLPSALITEPSDGAEFFVDQPIPFAGEGEDPEDGVLSASVFVWEVSINDGPFQTFAAGIKSGTAVAFTPGSYVARLTVEDSDGSIARDEVLITVINETPPANQPPRALITEPSDGAEFSVGQPIPFAGEGEDPEDGVLPASVFVWEVSINGGPFQTFAAGIKSGTAVAETSGTYVARLTVEDSDNEKVSDEIVINLIP